MTGKYRIRVKDKETGEFYYSGKTIEEVEGKKFIDQVNSLSGLRHTYTLAKDENIDPRYIYHEETN